MCSGQEGQQGPMSAVSVANCRVQELCPESDRALLERSRQPARRPMPQIRSATHQGWCAPETAAPREGRTRTSRTLPVPVRGQNVDLAVLPRASPHTRLAATLCKWATGPESQVESQGTLSGEDSPAKETFARPGCKARGPGSVEPQHTVRCHLSSLHWPPP